MSKRPVTFWRAIQLSKLLQPTYRIVFGLNCESVSLTALIHPAIRHVAKFKRMCQLLCDIASPSWRWRPRLRRRWWWWLCKVQVRTKRKSYRPSSLNLLQIVFTVSSRIHFFSLCIHNTERRTIIPRSLFTFVFKEFFICGFFLVSEHHLGLYCMKSTCLQEFE